jgi:hypothetical protein
MRWYAIPLCFSILLGMFTLPVSAADGTPKRRQFSSPSGAVVLRVSTKEENNTVTGTAVRIDDAGETVIWEKPLAYMPEKAFVSDAGELIAVQKIELTQAGYYQARAVENAVTAYNSTGEAQANYKLTDFTEHQKLWDRISGATNRSAKVFSDTNAWSASCKFEIDDLHGQLLITPESGLSRRIDFKSGGKSYLPPGKELEAPTVKLLGVAKGDRDRLIFEVVNRNDMPLSYHGYLRDSFSPDIPPGWVYPLYQIERIVDGKGERVDLGFCKTGQGEVMLPAMARERFHVDIPKEASAGFRVGLRWDPGRTDHQDSVVWTENLMADAIAKLPEVEND